MKTESGIHGKYYERNTLTLIALKCLFNKNIKDFWILSNPSDVKIFDDLILLVEYQNSERKLIMMQIKHVKNISKPMVVEKLDSSNKDFGLETYQEAFRSNTPFFDNNDIPTDTEIVYVLYSNCKVTTTERKLENENIKFQSTKPLDFINSALEKNKVFKLTRKSGKYEDEFLDKFYFYTEQLNKNEEVEAEIKSCLGGDIKVAKEMISHFYKWAEPNSDTAQKLHKLDIKTLLLDIFSTNFEPPGTIGTTHQNELLDIIREFNATIISEKHSLEVLWSESFMVLQESRLFDQDEMIELSSWKQPVSKNIQESLHNSCFKYSEDFLLNQKGLNGSLTTKTLFLLMVSLSKIPFIIKDDNHLFEIFKILLPSLDIISVILQVKKEELYFDNLTVCKTLNDINDDILLKKSKKIMVSFQGKPEINLASKIQECPEIRKAISIDNFIELSQGSVEIGKASNLPAFYINRNITVPVLKKDVLNALELKRSRILIFNILTNKTLNKYKSMDLTTFLEKSKSCDLTEFNILTSFDDPDHKLINRFGINEKLYVLKYIPQHNVFSLVYTNYSTNILRPYLSTIRMKDTNLIDLAGVYGMNVICSNAGMGNSMLLDFLNQNFPAKEWVVRLQRNDYSVIKEMTNLDQLFDYIFEHERKIISYKSDNFFKALYDHFKCKMIWLIDDYETIKEPHVLKLFKEAAEKGVRIWIAGRSSTKIEFENLFKVFSMSLTVFSRKDQNIFYQKYTVPISRKKDKIKKIQQVMQNKRNLFDNSFIGIPRNTTWFVKLILKYTKNKKQILYLSDSYEIFLNWNVMELSEIDRGFYVRTLSKLALSVFFPDPDLLELFKFDLEEFAQDVNAFRNEYPKEFFIKGFKNDDRPLFYHNVCAEFLSARWLVHTLKKHLNRQSPSDIKRIILKMLYDKRLRSVRLFFDELLTKKLPFSKISSQGKFINFSFTGTDILGRTRSHIMSSYGNYHEIQSATKMANLKSLHEYVQIINNGENIFLEFPTSSKDSNTLSHAKDMKNIQDFFKEDYLGLLPADYALLSGSLIELNEILKHHANYSVPFDLQRKSIEISQKCRELLMFHSIKNGYDYILANLDFSIKITPSNISFVHQATNSNDMELLTATPKIIVWGSDNEGNTPLHLACNQRDLNCLRILIKSDRINRQFFNFVNNDGYCQFCLLPYPCNDKPIEQIIGKYLRYQYLFEDNTEFSSRHVCEIMPLMVDSSRERSRY